MELLLHPWACWILFAIICGIFEVTLPSFTFSFASLAAVVAAVISLQYNVIFQVLAFGAILVLSILALRPRLQRLFPRSQPPMPSRAEALVGFKGLVMEAVDPVTGSGRVVVEGHDWAARSAGKIELNKEVKVTGHDGIVLLVKEI